MNSTEANTIFNIHTKQSAAKDRTLECGGIVNCITAPKLQFNIKLMKWNKWWNSMWHGQGKKTSEETQCEC